MSLASIEFNELEDRSTIVRPVKLFTLDVGSLFNLWIAIGLLVRN